MSLSCVSFFKTSTFSINRFIYRKNEIWNINCEPKSNRDWYVGKESSFSVLVVHCGPHSPLRSKRSGKNTQLGRVFTVLKSTVLENYFNFVIGRQPGKLVVSKKCNAIICGKWGWSRFYK